MKYIYAVKLGQVPYLIAVILFLFAPIDVIAWSGEVKGQIKICEPGQAWSNCAISNLEQSQGLIYIRRQDYVSNVLSELGVFVKANKSNGMYAIGNWSNNMVTNTQRQKATFGKNMCMQYQISEFGVPVKGIDDIGTYACCGFGCSKEGYQVVPAFSTDFQLPISFVNRGYSHLRGKWKIMDNSGRFIDRGVYSNRDYKDRSPGMGGIVSNYHFAYFLEPPLQPKVLPLRLNVICSEGYGLTSVPQASLSYVLKESHTVEIIDARANITVPVGAVVDLKELITKTGQKTPLNKKFKYEDIGTREVVLDLELQKSPSCVKSAPTPTTDPSKVVPTSFTPTPTTLSKSVDLVSIPTNQNASPSATSRSPTSSPAPIAKLDAQKPSSVTTTAAKDAPSATITKPLLPTPSIVLPSKSPTPTITQKPSFTPVPVKKQFTIKPNIQCSSDAILTKNLPVFEFDKSPIRTTNGGYVFNLNELDEVNLRRVHVNGKEVLQDIATRAFGLRHANTNGEYALNITSSTDNIICIAQSKNIKVVTNVSCEVGDLIDGVAYNHQFSIGTKQVKTKSSTNTHNMQVLAGEKITYEGLLLNDVKVDSRTDVAQMDFAKLEQGKTYTIHVRTKDQSICKQKQLTCLSQKLLTSGGVRVLSCPQSTDSKYEFRYKKNDGEYQSLGVKGQRSPSVTIDTLLPGAYTFMCRPCKSDDSTGATCADWDDPSYGCKQDLAVEAPKKTIFIKPKIMCSTGGKIEAPVSLKLSNADISLTQDSTGLYKLELRPTQMTSVIGLFVGSISHDVDQKQKLQFEYDTVLDKKIYDIVTTIQDENLCDVQARTIAIRPVMQCLPGHVFKGGIQLEMVGIDEKIASDSAGIYKISLKKSGSSVSVKASSNGIKLNTDDPITFTYDGAQDKTPKKITFTSTNATICVPPPKPKEIQARVATFCQSGYELVKRPMLTWMGGGKVVSKSEDAYLVSIPTSTKVKLSAKTEIGELMSDDQTIFDYNDIQDGKEYVIRYDGTKISTLCRKKAQPKTISLSTVIKCPANHTQKSDPIIELRNERSNEKRASIGAALQKYTLSEGEKIDIVARVGDKQLMARTSPEFTFSSVKDGQAVSVVFDGGSLVCTPPPPPELLWVQNQTTLCEPKKKNLVYKGKVVIPTNDKEYVLKGVWSITGRQSGPLLQEKVHLGMVSKTTDFELNIPWPGLVPNDRKIEVNYSAGLYDKKTGIVIPNTVVSSKATWVASPDCPAPKEYKPAISSILRVTNITKEKGISQSYLVSYRGSVRNTGDAPLRHVSLTQNLDVDGAEFVGAASTNGTYTVKGARIILTAPALDPDDVWGYTAVARVKMDELTSLCSTSNSTAQFDTHRVFGSQEKICADIAKKFAKTKTVYIKPTLSCGATIIASSAGKLIQSRFTDRKGREIGANLDQKTGFLKLTLKEEVDLLMSAKIGENQLYLTADPTTHSKLVQFDSAKNTEEVFFGSDNFDICPTASSAALLTTLYRAPLPTATPTPTPFAQGTITNITGYIWDDADKNGLQSQIESGVNGVFVQLLRCQDSNVAQQTVQTGSNGKYSFTSLQAGCYKVKVYPPVGYGICQIKSAEQSTKPTLDSDVYANGESDEISLSGSNLTPVVDACLIKQRVVRDISLKMSADKYQPKQWETVVLNILARNDGNAPATGLRIKTYIPSSMLYISHEVEGDVAESYHKDELMWYPGTIEPFQEKRLKVKVQIVHTTNITANAEVYTMTEGDIDSTPNNLIVTEDDYAIVNLNTPPQVLGISVIRQKDTSINQSMLVLSVLIGLGVGAFAIEESRQKVRSFEA